MKNQSIVNFLGVSVLCSALVLVQGCRVEEVVNKTDVPSTENSAFAADGRFFFIGDIVNPVGAATTAIYEVTQNGTDYEHNVVIPGSFLDQPCSFTGLSAKGELLYATCVINDPTIGTQALSLLVRVDLSKDVNDARYLKTAPLFGAFGLPNGSVVDANGDLYISDSNAYILTFLFGIPTSAIHKVSILDEEAFSINVAPWFAARPTEYFPNGLRVKGNSVFHASGNHLIKIDILDDGSAGEASTVYDAPETNLIDDFDVGLGGLIVTSEITTPFVGIVPLVYPEAVLPEVPEGKLVTLSKSYSVFPSHVLGVLNYEDGTLPSSVMFEKGRLFEPGSVLVTDFFGGGVQQVTVY